MKADEKTNAGKPLRVLFVEDSKTDADYLAFLLKNGGFTLTRERVDTAEVLEQALKNATWDVIISDYKMPHLSCEKALELVRKTDPDIPFVIVSGAVGEEVAVELMKAGASDFISKTNPNRLVPAIKRELQETQDRQGRKRAEEMLRTEASFRSAIIERVGEGLCVCHAIPESPYMAFTVWNARMTEITSYTMEQINRLGWYQTMYPDPEIQARAVKRMDRMRQGDDLVAEEWEITRADGQRRTLVISTRLIHASDDCIHVLALMQDITERKKAEQILHESETQLRAVLNNAPITIFVMDAQGRFTLSEGKGLERVGLKSGENVGVSALELYGAMFFFEYPDTVISGKDVVRRAFAGETVSVINELRGVWFDNRIGPFRNADGKIVGIIGVATDITDRKKAEEVLRESENRFHSLVTSSMDAVLLTVPDGRILFANKTACRMFGRSEQELILLGHDCVVDTSDPRLAPALEERARTGKFHGELMLMRKDGTKFLSELSSMVFTDRHGEVRTSMVIRDITERKFVEERIRMFSRELLVAREDEKKRVSSVLHHDVGSLAVGLSAHFDAIEDDVRSGRPGEALKWIKRVRKLLDQSVNRLKDVAIELRPPELDVLGLNAALRYHFSQVTKLGNVRIHFTETLGKRRVPDNVATVVFRIVQEALTNAIKHGHAKKVDVRVSASKKEISLTVCNNGKGFHPGGSDGKTSSHLGLHMMEEMAASIGGAFTVDSAPGKGTTVRVNLPIQKTGRSLGLLALGEDRRQKTEDRRQKTEDRRQKTEDRRQGRGSRPEIGCHFGRGEDRSEGPYKI